MVSALALSNGDTIQIGGPSSNLLEVLRRVKGGYAVLPKGEEIETFISDQLLLDEYVRSNLKMWPCRVDQLDERKAEMLQRPLDALSDLARRETMRRLAYVTEVDQPRSKYPAILDVCKAIGPAIFERKGPEWQTEERDAAVQAAALVRKNKGQCASGAVPEFKKIKEPKPTTIRTWYSDWVKCGRDFMALAPRWSDRGNHSPRFPVDEKHGLDTYSLATRAIEEVYLSLLRPSKQLAYEYYDRLCRENGVNSMSYKSFRQYIKKKYNAYDIYSARYGKKKAYLKFGTFEIRDLPNRALEEVEIDHCLVDLLVVDDEGRVLGRPWITVIIDRATKIILGIHISFTSPSYATVQRALAHSLYPKDLSRFQELKNEWSAFGLPECIISDRGKELVSQNFHEACMLLGIIPIALPGRKPWLKGAIERIFRSMHARVFDLKEGSTKAWDPDCYNSAKRAKITRQAFDQMVVEWIVDDYHQRPHKALKHKYGREMTPDQAWSMLSKFVRFAPDPDVAFRLTGKIFKRKITVNGVSIKNHLYLDKSLFERLLKRHGGKERSWTFRRDQFDLGRIWLLDEASEGGVTWHVIPCVDPEISDGVTEPQFSLWLEEARESCGKADELTVEKLREAKARVEANRSKALNGTLKIRKALQWAKYGEIGRTFTPIAGFGEHYAWGRGFEPSSCLANDDPDSMEESLATAEQVSEIERCLDKVKPPPAGTQEAQEEFEKSIGDDAMRMLKDMGSR